MADANELPPEASPPPGTIAATVADARVHDIELESFSDPASTDEERDDSDDVRERLWQRAYLAALRAERERLHSPIRWEPRPSVYAHPILRITCTELDPPGTPFPNFSSLEALRRWQVRSIIAFQRERNIARREQRASDARDLRNEARNEERRQQRERSRASNAPVGADAEESLRTEYESDDFGAV